MCGRFELDASPHQVARQFGLPEAPALPNVKETRPTDQGLIIIPGMKTGLRAFGFPAPWSGKGGRKPVFNARAETLMEKPVFSPHLSNRCLIPATSFPEWRKEGKKRFRHRVSLAKNDSEGQQPIMAFAGLHDETHFAIITCAANNRMVAVHSRMPVILPGETTSIWLDPNRDIADVVSVLRPYPNDDLLVEEDYGQAQEQLTRQPDFFT